jgi:regulator of protease activity HflC (stomatin/prohibitin superfamily)
VTEFNVGFGVILLSLGILFFIIFVVKGFIIVHQAETMVIERLGKYNRSLKSGINIIFPLLEVPRTIEWVFTKENKDGEVLLLRQRLRRIDLRETVFNFPRQNVITKDNVVTEINALLYFQITDPFRAVYEIANLPDAIEKLTQTTLRNVIGEMDLDETLSSRDTINGKLRIILDEATDKWGVKVNRVELQDINPPPDIRDAMEKQMRAERNRRASILDAEGLKRSAILQAEGERESDIQKAEGAKQAQILRAEGEAEARIRVANGEAEAINLVTQAVASSHGDPSTYLIAIRYIEALQAMASGEQNRVIFLPLEATGILGSLGGIKELFSGINKTT